MSDDKPLELQSQMEAAFAEYQASNRDDFALRTFKDIATKAYKTGFIDGCKATSERYDHALKTNSGEQHANS